MKEIFKIYCQTSRTKWEVSNLGKVLKNGNEYKLKVDRNGYLFFHPMGKTKTVHRAIAEIFIDNPNNYPTVDHIDRNNQNNIISNLRWVSWSEQNNNRDKEKFRINQSLAQKKRYESPEEHIKQGFARRGKHFTNEQKLKISNSRKGTKLILGPDGKKHYTKVVNE